MGFPRSFLTLLSTLLVTSIALGQSPPQPSPAGQPGDESAQPPSGAPAPYYHEFDPKPHPATYYHDGRAVSVDVMTSWKYVCGSNTAQGSVDDLAQIAANHAAAVANGPAIVLGADAARAGQFTVIYNLDASVPANAVNSFALAKAYLESKFSNPVIVIVTVSFAPLGSGVIGATGSSFASQQNYPDSRAGLVNGMDSTDNIQTWLPLGPTCPVRLNGASATVSNWNSINWTTANFKASLGYLSTTDGAMTYNSQFSFDFDPSNGVSGLSLVDTIVHETGHALGFVSAGDDFVPAITPLDLYRFQFSDGCCDYNPDSQAEFQTTTRTVSYNSPNDDAISDFITVEYRMSDGTPYQASHFREQSPSIGIMDPAMSSGSTNYPNYFKQSDLDAFDAIGWQYPPCAGPTITLQPTATQTRCPGGSFSLSTASSTPGVTYQWRRQGTPLVDGPDVSGSATSTVTVSNVTASDSNKYYNCVVTLGTCSSTTSLANVTVLPAPNITTQPSNTTVTIGGNAAFVCSATPPANFTYQWRKGGVNLTNGGRISGATSTALAITGVQADDAGGYDCVVTDISTGCVKSSNTATLTAACFQFTVQPGSTTICERSPASLSTAVDVGGVQYNWWRGANLLSDGPNVAGATTSTLTILATGLSDAGNDYYCVVSRPGENCSAASGVGTINVTPGPGFAQQPANRSGGPGDLASFSVAINGQYFNFTYQWRHDGSNMADDDHVSGAQMPTLVIDPLQESDAGNYDCVVTSILNGCTATSTAASLTVGGPPPCPGDLNGDLQRDLGDLSVILAHYGLVGATPEQGDLDQNGVVDLSDLSLMLSYYGVPC